MLAKYQEKLDRDPNDLWSTESKTEKEKNKAKRLRGGHDQVENPSDLKSSVS